MLNALCAMRQHHHRSCQCLCMHSVDTSSASAARVNSLPAPDDFALCLQDRFTHAAHLVGSIHTPFIFVCVACLFSICLSGWGKCGRSLSVSGQMAVTIDWQTLPSNSNIYSMKSLSGCALRLSAVKAMQNGKWHRAAWTKQQTYIIIRRRHCTYKSHFLSAAIKPFVFIANTAIKPVRKDKAISLGTQLNSFESP